MPIRHGGMLARQASTWPRDSFRRITIAPVLFEADEVERVLADVDADRRNGFSDSSLAWHGILLVMAAPDQLCGGVGREHGGSIALADVKRIYRNVS